MTNIQQPEMRRSEDKTRTTEQHPEDPHPTAAPGGAHDKTGDRPMPEGQVSPYGPTGKVADDDSGDES